MSSPNQVVRWRKTDSSDWLAHCQNHQELDLIYGRIYTKGEGYSYSETNQLILNLKIPPNAASERLYYKQQAIQQFAREVTSLIQTLSDSEQRVVLVPIPPSKAKGHPEYDDRIEQVAQRVAATLRFVSCLPLIYRITTVESHHSTGNSRSPNEIYQDLAIDESLASQYSPEQLLIILDDVLTSGAHFTAVYRRLQERFEETEMMGLFWAKAQEQEDFW